MKERLLAFLLCALVVFAGGCASYETENEGNTTAQAESQTEESEKVYSKLKIKIKNGSMIDTRTFDIESMSSHIYAQAYISTYYVIDDNVKMIVVDASGTFKMLDQDGNVIMTGTEYTIELE